MANVKKNELSKQDRILLCAVAVLGRDYAETAYLMGHRSDNATPQSLQSMVSRWLNNEKAKDFIKSIRQTYAEMMLDGVDDDSRELSDKELSAIIQKGILTEKDLKRKSEMSLKLMEWRKKSQADIQDEEDRRTYVLRWLSACKTCKLMQLFLEIKEKEKE